MDKGSKKKQPNLKRIFATAVILFIVFIFSLSIFLSYSDRSTPTQEFESIAEVNGKPVEFYGNSPVVREYERLREIYKTRTKEEVLTKAVQNVIVGMLTEEFAKNNGFDITDEFIDKVTAENIYAITRKSDVSSHDIKLARLNVESILKSSYLPTKINTFVSRIPKRSQVSFYIFKSLDDRKISLQLVEFDEVEYIRRNEIELNIKEIEKYYLSNYKDIVVDAKISIDVEKFIFSDRASAFSFVSNIGSSYEEKVLVKLDPEKNKNIITGLPDDINSLSKPFFENRKYVVYKVARIASFDTLTQKLKDYVSLKYTLSNYPYLQGKYSDRIRNEVNKIKDFLIRNEITKVSTVKGVKLYTTGKFSIVKALTEYIPDTKGEALSLPREFYDLELISSLFKKSQSDIGVADVGQSTKVIYKVLTKEVIPSKISEVADKIYSAYQFLYQESIFADWTKSIEKSGDVKIKDISKFAREL
ncbi:MAG: hypothetical protein N2712_05490 [Brevinematales bacterium]|nr:hypothetical protein [Brevinematales bacterium]